MRVVSIDQRMKLRGCCLPPEATSSRSMPVLLAPCQSAPPRTGLTRLPPLTWPPKGHEKGHKKDKAKAKQNFWLWHRGVKDLTLLMRGKTPAGLNKLDTYPGEGDQVDVVISELCSADHRRRSRSLTAALRPSADVAALLRTRTPRLRALLAEPTG